MGRWLAAVALVPITKAEDPAAYKARRYRDTQTGETFSRRQAEGLTESQRLKRQYKAQGYAGKLAPSREEKHHVRYGPYKTLDEALSDPRLQDTDKVIIGAKGPLLVGATSGGGRKDGWLSLFQTSEYEALRPLRGEPRRTIAERLEANFFSVQGYYVWLAKE